MAKGQKRGNRETRKPKQDKPAAKPDSTLGQTSKVFEKANEARLKGR